MSRAGYELFIMKFQPHLAIGSGGWEGLVHQIRILDRLAGWGLWTRFASLRLVGWEGLVHQIRIIEIGWLGGVCAPDSHPWDRPSVGEGFFIA